MTVDIDPTTGMPALAKGERWNVYKNHDYLGETLYAVSLEVQTSVPQSDKRIEEPRGWWARRLGRPPRYHYEPQPDTLEWVSVYWQSVTETDPDNEDEVRYAREVTRENVLETAKKALGERDEQLAREEREQELLGTYPPKSL